MSRHMEWHEGAGREIEVETEDNVVPMKAKKPANSKITGLFAKTPLEALTNRALDDYHPAINRLLLWLQIRSFRGKKEVRLTNEMVAGIGLDRHQKRVCLIRLEEDGYVTVKRSGKRVPVVKLVLG